MPSIPTRRAGRKVKPGAVRLCASGLHRAERRYRRAYASNVLALNTLRSWERYVDMPSTPFAGISIVECRAEVPISGAWADLVVHHPGTAEQPPVIDLLDVKWAPPVTSQVTIDLDAWLELDDEVRESLIEDLMARVRASRSAPVTMAATPPPPASQCRLMASSTVGANAPPVPVSTVDRT